MECLYCPDDFVDQLTIITNGMFSKDGAQQIREHLTSHKYFLGLKLHRSPTWCETMESYKREIFIPVYNAIYSWNFDVTFPKTKKEELYFKLTTYLYYLRQNNPNVSIEEASKNFCCAYGSNRKGKLLVNILRKIS
jgi:hypothetical protein